MILWDQHFDENFTKDIWIIVFLLMKIEEYICALLNFMWWINLHDKEAIKMGHSIVHTHSIESREYKIFSRIHSK